MYPSWEAESQGTIGAFSWTRKASNIMAGDEENKTQGPEWMETGQQCVSKRPIYDWSVQQAPA